MKDFLILSSLNVRQVLSKKELSPHLEHSILFIFFEPVREEELSLYPLMFSLWGLVN